MRKDSKLSTAE